MRTIRITQDCLLKGEHQAAGTIIENVDNGIAAEIIAAGRAVEVKATAREVGIENREPITENRDQEITPKKPRKPKPQL